MDQLFLFSVFLNLVAAQAFMNESDASDPESVSNIMARSYEDSYEEDMRNPRTQSQVFADLQHTMSQSTWFD